MPCMRDVAVQLLDTGSCRHPEAMAVSGGAWRTADFPALAALLLHPEEGPILFDTGYDPAFFAATGRFPEFLYRLVTPARQAPEQAAAAQLRRRGIAPEEVRHLVLSHFHGDHVAGLVHFPNAAIHCARAGYLALCRGRLAGLRQGFLPALLPADFAARCRYFEEGRPVTLPAGMQPFELGVDLLGDGSVLAVELPGHCPGHWGVVVQDGLLGPHFLVGDAAWSSAAIRDNRPPPRVTGNFLGDSQAGRATLGALHRLFRRNSEIVLTPSHCRERAQDASCPPS